MTTHQSLEPQERIAALNRRTSTETGTTADNGPTAHPLLNLQRQVGNTQIARMLAQREGDEEKNEEQIQAKHDPAIAQRQGEEKKDEDQVQAMHDPALAQREGAEDEEEQVQAKHDLSLAQRAPDDEEVHAKPEVGLEGGPISSDLSGRIQAKRGSGTALDDGMRTNMEGAFGTSFKDVRVHTDSESDVLNRSISAKAFTTGNDIFFRGDTSPSDNKLMSHELTHVVQQRGMSGGGSKTVGPAGDHHEQQADAMASVVSSGGAAAAQREADEVTAQHGIAREAEEEEQQG